MSQYKFLKVLISDTFYNFIANFSRNFNNQHLPEFAPLPIHYRLLEMLEQRWKQSDIVLWGLPDKLRSSYDSIFEATLMVPRASYLIAFPIQIK